MTVRLWSALLAVALLSACGVAPFARPTPMGDWKVSTDPSATVGRSVEVIFRFRDGDTRPPTDSFSFTATCMSCPEPKPTVTGTATKQSASASEALYSGAMTFPNVGSWWTSPFVGPIEVR